MASSTPAVRRLPNGLLDLEVTPEHLVPIVQRNTTESPLLRLPAEIRKKIYEFALSGFEFFHSRVCCPDQINPPDYRCKSCEDHKGGCLGCPNCVREADSFPPSEYRFHVFTSVNDSPIPAYHLDPWDEIFGINPRSTSIFALPSTCRQLYSETTTLPYKLGTFIFREPSSIIAFHRLLLPAQRDAVGTLCTTSVVVRVMKHKHNVCQLVEIFPSLRRVWLCQRGSNLIPKCLVGFFGDTVEVKGFALEAVPSELGPLSTWKTVEC